VAGLHTAEGPGIDPFLLVPTDAASSDWRLRTISEGPAELRGLARAGVSAIFAWIHRVDIHDKPIAPAKYPNSVVLELRAPDALSA